MSDGSSNIGWTYTVNDKDLRSVDTQSDLGVLVHSTLKMAT